METKRQPKAIHRIGDVHFVLNGMTVTALERCGPVTVGDHSEHYFWHFAGCVGLEELMAAACHGIQTLFRGRSCARLNPRCLPVEMRHEFWLSADDTKALLVRVDERQQVTP